MIQDFDAYSRMQASTSDLFPQIIYGVVVVLVIYLVYMGIEMIWRVSLDYSTVRIPVYMKTGESAKVFTQDPTNSDSVYLPISQNQLTGIEFSYCIFIYIKDNTFIDNVSPQSWSTIFYKGYEAGPFPLCGPGVFASTDRENNPVLRIVMNSYNGWFNKVDVSQIPVNKWFHLALVMSANNTLNVYINGNLANKLVLDGTIAYQNYQSLNVLPVVRTATITDFDNSRSTDNSLRGIPPGETFVIKGPISGFVSNIVYYSYAIGYGEIQANVNAGPSTVMDTSSMAIPPYLIDTWWTQQRA
jgi:hypothetical protein